MTVAVQNDNGFSLGGADLVAAAQAVLRQHAADASSLTIAVMDDEAVAALNAQFRRVSAPTDVLSFPTADLRPGQVSIPAYLGDLAIAYPYASAQATASGHSLVHNLSLLVVHGVLHLLGYDHDTPAARAAMWAAQRQALDALGVPQSIVPALEEYE